MRRTKATLIYRRTKNVRAVQLLLGHSKLELTVRYLGIKVDDALEISEQTEIRGRTWRPPALEWALPMTAVRDRAVRVIPAGSRHSRNLRKLKSE